MLVDAGEHERGPVDPVHGCGEQGQIGARQAIAALAGGAAGPWVTGVIHDQTGSYAAAFWIGLLVCAVSVLSIWIAGPRKVRAVAGQMDRLKR